MALTTGTHASAGKGRIVMLALCGGADRPLAVLGGRTPFVAAATPGLDRLAARGSIGLLEVIAGGVPPESDSGAMALLGYDPLVHYTGRGPLEAYAAMGTGTPMVTRLVSGSTSPARTREPAGASTRRTARDLSDAELGRLVEEITAQIRLDEDITVRLTGWGRHRGILAFTSRRWPLSGEVSNTDPGFAKSGAFGIPVAGHDNLPLSCKPLADDEGANRVAVLVNAFVAQSARIMSASEVNARRVEGGRKPAKTLPIRDGGHVLPRLDPAPAQISMYGQVPAERGLARLIGARFTVARQTAGQSVAELLCRADVPVARRSRGRGVRPCQGAG